MSVPSSSGQSPRPNSNHGSSSDQRSTSELPPNPDLRHLKLQAKNLLKACKAGDADALRRVEPYLDPGKTPSLASAQLAIAREYGLSSWTRLKIHVENAAKSFAELLDTFLSECWHWGDARRAAEALKSEPALANANLYAACAALDVDAVTRFLADETSARTVVTKKGGPRKWVPLLYVTWSSRLANHTDAAIEIIELLIRHGADPKSSWKNKEYEADESALYGSVEADCDVVAQKLLELGADPNDGESLYHACEHQNLRMLDVLAAHGLAKDDVSYCVKHAMDYRWQEGIEWFLDHGADPNAVHPSSGETSLHWAIKRNCNADIICSLLEHGADPNARTLAGRSAFLGIKGWTPLEFALRLGRTDVCELLRQRGAAEPEHSDVDRLVIACAAGDSATADTLLSESPNLFDEVDDDDQRLVAHVAQCEQWEGVRAMVQRGWRPDQPGGWMEATPLIWAVCFGNAAMVDFLLNQGADPNHESGGYFRSPLRTLIGARWREGDTQHGSGDYEGTLSRLMVAAMDVPNDIGGTGSERLDDLLDEARS